jgi:hypothetical protein
MALSTRHRATIYAKLTPILGEEEADALLAEFPTADHDRLVTEGTLRAELATLRAEIADLRTEMHQLANRQLVVMTTAIVAAVGVAAGLT